MRMRWCRDCGGYIEFRDTSGQARDLPECCCMGEPTPGLTADKVRAGFCQLTSCTVCGAPVFFIRHAEGRLWLDDLAYPWPKHKCFNSPLHATLQQLKAGDWPLLGIVVSVDESGKIRVRLQDGREINYLLIKATAVAAHAPLPLNSVRTLLVVGGESLEIIHPANLRNHLEYIAEPGDNKVIKYGSHPLPGATQTNRRGVPVISCTFCSETFSSEKEKGEHLKNHPDWPCPYCSYTTLLNQELENHIKNKHPART